MPVRVLLYNGELDLNCNFIGTQRVLENNLWRGKQWSSAERALWRVQDTVMGEVFELDNLMFLIVRNAGHLLPMDVPATALELLTRFVEGQSFKDVPLRSDAYYAALTSDFPAFLVDGGKDGEHNKHGKDKTSKNSSLDPKRRAKLNSLVVLLIFAAVMVASIVFFRSIFRDDEGAESAALLSDRSLEGYQSSASGKVRLSRGS